MKAKQLIVFLTVLILSGTILFSPLRINNTLKSDNIETEPDLKSSDTTEIFRPIGNVQTLWDVSDFSRINEEVMENEEPDGIVNYNAGGDESAATDIFYMNISNVKIYTITIFLYACCEPISDGGEAKITITFGHGESDEWSSFQSIHEPFGPEWISFTWEGLYYVVNNLQIALDGYVFDGRVSVDAMYAEITYIDMVSEKYRPTENFYTEWEDSDFSYINEEVIAPDLPDGIINSQSGLNELRTDIYNMDIRGVTIYSITIHLYAYCTIFDGERAQISVKYRAGNDKLWSTSQSIEDPFGPAWISFSWWGFNHVADNLQIGLIADIDATVFGGFVSVDALYVEIIYIDELRDDLSHVDDIDAEMVWGGKDGATNVSDPIKAGEGVKLCILDTGIDYNHPAFLGRYIGGHDYANNDDDPFDIVTGHYAGHGTKACGIIAASDDGMGNIGVAPRVDLYVVRVYDNDGYISSPWTTVVNGINWAITNEMDVVYINVQIPTSSILLGLACIAAYSSGIVLVAPTGNYPEWGVAYPAKYSCVIAVGAVKKDGTEYIRSDTSGYGPELDVVAITNGYTTLIEGGYGMSLYGTSFSGPYAAGVCALIRAQNPEYTPDQVKEALLKTCKDQINSKVQGEAGYDAKGWDEYYGYGLINAYGACDQEKPSVNIIAPESPVTEGIGYYCKAIASDNYRVDKVQFKINNGNWHDAQNVENSDVWKWYWLVGSSYSYTVHCRAYDALGNYQDTSKVVYVTTGGGCPILSVYDGEDFITEGLLDIHNPDGIDEIYEHILLTQPFAGNHRYHLRLTEHNKTISHIDKVELWGKLTNGRMIKLPLLSAIHNELGQVRFKLWFSDDEKTTIKGADHNNGVSQFIDLQFLVLQRRKFTQFLFVIEGNNIMVK